jgi:hypothetical protein
MDPVGLRRASASLPRRTIVATSLRTVGQLRVRVARDQGLRDALKADPETTLAGLDAEPIPDTWVYKIVVMSLGIVVLVCAVGAIYLAALTPAREIPDLLIALGSAAVGALAGLLAPSPGATGG